MPISYCNSHRTVSMWRENTQQGVYMDIKIAFINTSWLSSPPSTEHEWRDVRTFASTTNKYTLHAQENSTPGAIVLFYNYSFKQGMLVQLSSLDSAITRLVQGFPLY